MKVESKMGLGLRPGDWAEENKVAEFGEFHYLKRRGENRIFSRPFGNLAKK
jgi:hypothetical protein